MDTLIGVTDRQIDDVALQDIFYGLTEIWSCVNNNAHIYGI